MWTAYNAFLSKQNLPVATVCYLSRIRAPLTDLTTIYVILLKLVKIADVTAVCAIHSKAQNILWNKPEPLDGKVTMRLGGIHLVMVYVASIGELYGDGGVFFLLVDFDVYAPTTGRLMLQGEQVSRGKRGMKLVLEALYEMYDEAFWNANKHTTTLQALQKKFTATGMTQSASFAYRDTFMQGMGTLLRLLRAERECLLQLCLIAVCKTIPWCRAADQNN